jgi:eukaryotic-like serine/threonine-protein kinase
MDSKNQDRIFAVNCQLSTVNCQLFKQPTMLWTPEQILQTRPYRIESILGQGGFGITYKATHLQLNHQVVLKTPNAGLQNDPEYANFVGRFIREGQMLAQFCQNAHPGIVRISDLFEEKGLHCLVMDLVVGQSLFDAVQQRGRLPDTEAVTIIRQIGEALIDVHQAGIVHRDVHPGNIMLRLNEQAVLINFGIANQLAPMVSTRLLAKSLSRTGILPVPQELWEMSTSKHCSHRDFAPWEQQMEGSGEPTVDIYALAASLYYAVTGQTPTPSVNRQFENATLPPANDFGVKDWVSQAIEKGMESDPQKRPQSMQDWLNYLQETPTIPSVSVQLKSARDVDYTRLRDLLLAGEWQEADLETRNVMLKAAGREQEGDLDLDSIETFPCDDLRTIDQLWHKYSYGRFGFSVQKKIWLSVGGKVDHKTECKLGDRVGWRKGRGKGGSWLNYSDLTFNKTAPRGHLPCWFGLWGVAEHFWCRVHSCLASRASNCNL